MTVARLVVEIEARINNLEQQLTKAQRAVNDFERDVQRSLATDSLLSKLNPAQTSAVNQLMGNMKRQFALGISDIKQQFAGGFIDERAAMQRVENLMSSMVKTANAGLQGIGASGIISGEALTRLIAFGESAGAKMGQAITQNADLTNRIASSLSGLEDVFARESTRISERLFRGMANEQEAAKQGGIAAGAFNDAWIREMDKIMREFKVPEHVRRMMVEQLKPAGIGFGQAVTEQQRALDIATEQIGKLQERFRTTIAKNKLDLAEGIIKPEEFEKKGNEAMQALERGIVHGRKRMRAANMLTSDVEQALAKALPKAGDAGPAGAKAGQDFVDGLEKGLKAREAQLRLDRFAGRLSEGKFAREGDRAAREFNNNLRRGLEDMHKRGLITTEERNQLVEKFRDTGLKAGTTFADGLIQGTRKLATELTDLGQTLTKSITIPMIAAGHGVVKMAGDFEAAENRLELAFGPAVDDVRKRLLALQKDVPATAIEIRNFATRVAEVFVQMGGATKEIDKTTRKIKDVAPGMEEGLRVVADMSEEIIKLSKNLVIVNPGVSAERAFNAIINATVGRTTELKKLGVVISQQIINETAYREGIARTGAVLTSSQNAQAAYIAIMERSQLIDKAVARAKETFNLKLEFTKKAFIEAGIAIGTVFLPPLVRMMETIRQLLISFAQLDKATLTTIAKFATIAAIVGPAVFVLGSLLKVVAALATAFRALSIAMSFGSGIGILASLAKMANPIGALVTVLGLAAAAFFTYRKATGDAAEANAKFTESLTTMTSAQLTSNMQRLMLESSGLNAQRDAIQREMINRATREAQAKNERLAGGAQRFQPNLVFNRDEQSRVDAIDEKLATIRQKLAAIGKVQEENNKLTQEQEAFYEEYRKEFEHFQKLARQESERERLNREKQAWLEFSAEVRAAISKLGASIKLGMDIERPLANVRALLEQVEDRMSKVDIGSRMHSQLSQFKDDLELAIKSAEKFDISGLRTAVSTQISAVTDLLSQVKGKGFDDRADLVRDINEHVRELEKLESRINVILTERLGTDKQRQAIERDLLRLKRAMRDADEARRPVTDIFAPGFEQRIDELGRRLRAADLRLQISPSLPPEARQKFENEVKAEIARIRLSIATELNKVIGGDIFAALTPKQRDELVGAIGDIFKRNEINAADMNEELSKTDRIVHRLAIGVRGISQLAEIFGDSAEGLRNMASAALNALEAIKQIRAAQRARATRTAEDPFASKGFNIEELAGVVSGIAGLAGGIVQGVRGLIDIFNGDQQYRAEIREIQRENNQRLAELRLAISAWGESINDRLEVARTLARPEAISAILAGSFKNFIGSFGKIGEKQIAQINRNLAQFGLTWEQLNAIAKNHGITLLDSKGRIVAGAFDKLTKAIEAQIEMDLRWKNGMRDMVAQLDDMRASVDLWNDVMNVEDTPARAIAQAAEEIRVLAPGLFEEFFAGIDPSDVNAMELALQRMTEAFILNKIDFEKFGGLLNKQQLTQIIQLMAGAFDELRSATDALTDSMLNVPTWFKREQTRFEAVSPRQMDIGGPAPQIPSEGIVANNVQISGGVNFNISQQPGESSEDFADRVVEKLRSDRFLETGSTFLPGVDN